MRRHAFSDYRAVSLGLIRAYLLIPIYCVMGVALLIVAMMFLLFLVAARAITNLITVIHYLGPSVSKSGKGLSRTINSGSGKPGK